jgi:hypothetical protein
MVDAKVEILNPPRSLPRFLALWLATYLIPFLVISAARFAVILALYPSSGRYAWAMILVYLFPIGLAVGLAVGQWMLMRSYVAKPRLWSVATLAGALLAQLSTTLVPAIEPRTLGLLPQLSQFLEILRSIFGTVVATSALFALPIASCYGAAWSIPQGLALPGPRSAKVVWIIALMLTGFVVIVMAETLTYELREALSVGREPTGVRRPPNLIAYGASGPILLALGWLILSLVSGSIMYWVLRRYAAATTSQVLTRFE